MSPELSICWSSHNLSPLAHSISIHQSRQVKSSILPQLHRRTLGPTTLDHVILVTL